MQHKSIRTALHCTNAVLPCARCATTLLCHPERSVIADKRSREVEGPAFLMSGCSVLQRFYLICLAQIFVAQ